MGGFQPLIDELGKSAEIIYLEDIRPTVHLADKLTGLAKAIFPRAALSRYAD